jgi:hypothetical protein
MQVGSLSLYFAGVGVKAVTGAGVRTRGFPRDEFQGIDSFRAFLGTPSEKMRTPPT